MQRRSMMFLAGKIEPEEQFGRSKVIADDA